MALFAALKADLRDYSAYESIFIQVIHNGLDSFGRVYGEHGYIFVNWVFSQASHSYIYFRFIYYAIFLYALFWLLLKDKRYVNFKALLYMTLFFYIDIVLLRYFAATVFFVWSIYLFYRKKYALTFIFILMGSFFHIAVVSTCLVYFLYYLDRRYQIKGTFYIFSIFIFLALSSVGFGNRASEVLIDLEIWRVSDQLKIYTQSKWSDSQGVLRGSVFLQLFFFILITFAYKLNRVNDNSFLRICYLSFYCGISFILLFNDFGIISDRINFLLIHPVIFLIPSIFLVFKSDDRPLVSVILAFVCSFVIYFFSYRGL
jgi:hypothetical protein